MHPDLASWIPALVAVHVGATLLFVLLHAPSVAATILLRRERELAGVQRLLGLSRRASELSWIGWLLLAISGALLASIEHTWGRAWVWGSAILLVALSLSMSVIAARAFNEAREAAGLAWFDGRRRRAPVPVDPAALAAALATIRARSVPLLLVGTGGLVALLWLMVARPG